MLYLPSSGNLSGWFMFIGSIIAVILPVSLFLDSYLYKFYIFDNGHLHDLAKRAIALHGNNTKDMVNYIVTDLHGTYPNNINLDEEWVFNNAGGAMGAMYILHASRSILSQPYYRP